MPYRELNFDRHNVAISMSEVKDMFRMHLEQGLGTSYVLSPSSLQTLRRWRQAYEEVVDKPGQIT